MLARPIFAAIIFLCLSALQGWADPSVWQAEGWKTDFAKMSVASTEIMSGGPPRDGIPPIDKPRFIAVGDANGLSPQDPVLSFEWRGEAKAYPLRVMIWHEIVNDTVAGTPVAVTYCPLCNSAIVFDASVNGTVLTFGTTGKLRNSDLVMYDRATESWWQQFIGEAIAGNYTGTKLKMLPSRLEGFADFAARHPQGKVLVPNDVGMRDYGRNPYAGYDTLPKPFLYDGEFPDGIDAMARVIVVRPNAQPPLIVSFEKLQAEKMFVHNGITLVWKPGQNSALDASDIAKGRDVGSVTAMAPDGAALPHDVTFAFVAHAFHRDVAIIK